MNKLIDLLTDFYNAYVLKTDSCYISSTVITQLTQSGNVISKGCNAIEFYNQGNTQVVVNDYRIILPGQTWSVNQCQPYVKDNQQYKLAIGTVTLPTPDDPGATNPPNPQCIVTTTFITVSR